MTIYRKPRPVVAPEVSVPTLTGWSGWAARLRCRISGHDWTGMTGRSFVRHYIEGKAISRRASGMATLSALVGRFGLCARCRVLHEGPVGLREVMAVHESAADRGNS